MPLETFLTLQEIKEAISCRHCDKATYEISNGGLPLETFLMVMKIQVMPALQAAANKDTLSKPMVSNYADCSPQHPPTIFIGVANIIVTIVLDSNMS
ncbi:hypothetical protein V6N11_057230 [Hibiscus sabdariffa]|uniref:Uncharacterized protein n=2 Tax=Hibiscus sabdariffa TaxID=183260 RepID=A0ABR2B3W6_9ROSI